MANVHHVARIMMGDRLNGTSGYIKALAEESINIAHLVSRRFVILF